MRRKQGKTILPRAYAHGHDLCFLNHGILLQMLVSGEKQGVFLHRLPLRDESERMGLERADNVFEWLEQTGRNSERTEVLRTIVFPVLLSDFLHFVFEALDTSRKGKLTVAYSLLRKPIQETLVYIFEVMLTDLERFGALMVEIPAVCIHSQLEA